MVSHSNSSVFRRVVNKLRQTLSKAFRAMMPHSNSSEFRSVVNQLKEALSKAFPDDKARDDWLRTLHQSYTQRFLSDNSAIWGTARILLPVSLAAFAVPARMEVVHLVPLIVLAIASSGLMFAWLVYAENHRGFQDKLLAWIIAIEETVRLEDPTRPKIGYGGLVQPEMVRKLIWGLTICVPIAWVVVVVAALVT